MASKPDATSKNCRALLIACFLIFIPALPAQELPHVIVADPGGRKEFLRAFAGDGLVVINFWASYCQPCQNEIPGLIKLLRQHPEVELIFVNLDGPAERAAALAMARQLKIDRLLLDRYQNTVRAFKTEGKLPFTILAQKGKILYRRTGYSPEMIGELAKIISSRKSR